MCNEETVKNYKLKKGKLKKLEDMIYMISQGKCSISTKNKSKEIKEIKIDGRCWFKKLPFFKSKNDFHKYIVSNVNINAKAMTVFIKTPNKEDEYFSKFTVSEITNYHEGKIERELLLFEYKDAQETGKHLDLLRWNVSKFFLSIQTVFIVVVAKGILELIKLGTVPEELITKLAKINEVPKEVITKLATETPTEQIFNKNTILGGIITLTVINISLCIIWWIRNKGIHGWHRTSITRQRIIELDPRLRHTIRFYSTIRRRLRGPEKKIHSTGELECWGPPFAFIALWVIVFVSALYFMKQV